MKNQKIENQDTELDFSKLKFNGVMPSPEDDRDYTPDMVAKSVVVFPEEYESKPIEILNQGYVGSCVAHACAEALMSGEENIIGKHNNFSIGYIYANRASTDTQTSGMYMRQALKQLNKCGDVLYLDFPYNIEYPEIKSLIDDKDDLAKKAKPFAIKNYFRCYTDDDIKSCIINRGAVLVCVPVYENFDKDLKHTSVTEWCKGYHAMLMIGWTKDGRWIVQNSWGSKWGYEGKLYMDKDYPRTEAWGITINTSPDINIPDKPNIFKRSFILIKQLFTAMWSWLMKFQSKNK